MRIFLVFLIFAANSAFPFTFDQAAKSSWGDPKFGVAARNFPKETLANDESSMTGIEYYLSQNIPLTTK